ncbi:MAG: sigma-70 family RNA polymerase sigma factor [Saprospiraceae bacterium]|nr:sigma-70 family RNA polymerase sigma factor [Saprospiraceae bacterium]
MFSFTFNPTEKELFEGLQNDKNWAYKILLERHTNTLKDYVTKNGGDMHDANEIEQRALIILYENIRAGKFIYKASVKLSTYLFSIAQHQWLNELKRRKRNLPSLGSDFVHFPESEEDFIEMGYRDHAIVKELSSLDPVCYKIITLRIYDKKSDKEICETLIGLEVKKIRGRREKCLKKLKRLLVKNYPNYFGDI